MMLLNRSPDHDSPILMIVAISDDSGQTVHRGRSEGMV